MARRPVGEPSGWNDKPTQGPSHNNKAETAEKPVRTDLEIDPKEGDMADNS